MESQETKGELEAQLVLLEKQFMHVIEQKAQAQTGEMRDLLEKDSTRIWSEISEIQRKLALL